MNRLRAIAVVGRGAFGRAITERAAARGIPVAAWVGREENPGGAALTHAALAGVDVVLEVSTAASAPDNAIACLRAGVPVVVGATGWQARLPDVEAAVRETGGALLHAANFAIGAWRFAELVAEAAARFPREGYDRHVVETHHAAKRDAPSGTARLLVEAIAARTGERPPVTSVRVGAVPGTHELWLDGAFEQVRLVHEVRDRRVFADGALDAAAWLVARRRHGVFTMPDLLAEETP